MQASEPSGDASVLDALAEEFIARHRCGERPSISEYVARQPDLAESIRDLFPTLVMMESARPTGELRGGFGIAGSESGKLLEQLGDYRILREIGRGGMGIVYEAEQETLGRHVALKVLPRHAMLDPRQLERFHHEARAAARLHHTNIVPVFGVGDHDGLHYHVMQFIQGLGLDEVLVEVGRLRDQKQSAMRLGKRETPDMAAPLSDVRSASHNIRNNSAPSVTQVAASLVSGQFQCSVDGSVTPREVSDCGLQPSATSSAANSLKSWDNGARSNESKSSSDIHLPGQNANNTESGGAYWNSIARIGVQVADALAYANLQGVLHRDIKPSNLLLDATGTVWVTDFGLAKTSESDRLTHTGDIVGTLRYMVPERFRGHSDIKCDIYSLGMTLYELLTLQPPFAELDRNKLIRQIAQEEPPRPRSIDRTLPRDLETIVLKAIAKQANDRYQNAESLAADLRRFIEDRPIQARRIGSAEWFWRWCRRNPLVASLTAAVIVLASVLSVGASVMHLVRNERDSALVNLNLAIDAEKAAKINQQRAEQAESEVKIRSHLAQATAYRHAGQAGRRVNSLDEIRQAMELNPSRSLQDALRDEAIACMVLVDLKTTDVPETAGESRIAFDPSYKQYATVDEDGKIHLRRVGQPEELCELPGLGHSVVGISFSQKGNYLLSSTLGDINLQIWDLKSGRGVFAEPIQSNINPSLCYDESKAAIMLHNGSIGLFNLASGSEADRLITNTIPKVIAFDPLGHHLAVASEYPPTLEIWNLEKKSVVAKWSDIDADIHSIAWAHDGQRLTIGLAAPTNCAEVRDVSTGLKLATFSGHAGDVTESFFHPSGDVLLTRSWDGFSRVWDANSARPFLAWPGGMGGNISEDGRILGHVHNRGKNQLVELVAEREYQTLVSSLGDGMGVYRDGSISPDGRLFALGMEDGVRIWDLQSHREVAFIETGQSPSPIFAPDGKTLIISGESGLQHWPVVYGPPLDSRPRDGLDKNLENYATTSTAESPAVDVIHIGPPRDVPLPVDPSFISNSERSLAVCSPRSSQALVVELATDSIRATLGPHSRLDRIVLSPDGRWAATYGWHSPTIKIWNAMTADLVKELPATMLTVNFSPDSQRLITCDSNEYSFWETKTWRKTKRIAREHCPFSGVIAFSPDGNIMALELSSAIITLMDVKSGETLARLEDPYRDRPNWMNFTPDGSKLVAVSNYSQCIDIWDLSSIRTKLRNLHLDWDSKPLVKRKVLNTAQWLHVAVDLGDFGPRSESRRQAKQAKALFDLANEHIQAKRWADALVTSKQVLELRPDNPIYNNNFAWLLVSCPDEVYRDGSQALQFAHKAVEQEPDASEHWNTLGVAYYRVGQWRRAVDALTKAEQLKPDENFGYNAFFLAMAHWQLGEKEAAREFYERAERWITSSNSPSADLREIEQFRIEANELFESLIHPD